MNRRTLAGLVAVLVVGFALARTRAATDAGRPTMTQRAAGPFDVTLTPVDPASKESGLGRVSIDKRFHGDLEGTSKGEMLSVLDPKLGSGGYVALERVSGKLGGRSGTFVLQHSGTMTRGVPGLVVSVVPDSGTGELEGLSGTMEIVIAKDRKHSYLFDYALPAPR